MTKRADLDALGVENEEIRNLQIVHDEQWREARKRRRRRPAAKGAVAE